MIVYIFSILNQQGENKGIIPKNSGEDLRMIDFSGIKWKELNCAYPNLAEEIPKQLNKLLDSHDSKEITDVMNELIINVNHQCDFNDSTMVVMNYLADFIKARSNDLEYAMMLISNFGSFYCWEENLDVEKEIQDKYVESVEFVKYKLLDFLEKDFKSVATYAQNNVPLTLEAFISLLDTNRYSKELAQQFIMSDNSEVSILCTNCEFEDEAMSIDSESLECAITDTEKWDHKDFSDTAKWIQNIYKDLLEKNINWVLMLAGTFTCPGCGKIQPTIDCLMNFMKNR